MTLNVCRKIACVVFRSVLSPQPSAFLLLFLLLAACAPTPEPLPLAEAPARIIEFWEPVQDQLTQINEAHPWQFVGAKGDAVRVRLSNQNVAVTLTLQSADGTALGRGNDMRIVLPADGLYTAMVRLSQPMPSPYTLSLDYTDRADPAIPTLTPTATLTAAPTLTPTPIYQPLGLLVMTLPDGGAHDGSFSRTGERHVYLFSGEAGQFASIRMAKLSGSVDPSVTLFGPEGQPLAYDDNSGGDLDAYLSNVRLPANGQYIIQASGDGLSGDYRIELVTGATRVPVTPNIPQPSATPTPTETAEPRNDRLLDHLPVTGRILNVGDFARYPIVTRQGDVITVGVSPTSGETLKPQIELYNPQGQLVASANSASSNAGGDALIASYPVAEAGTYVALVRADRTETGEFVISYGLGDSRADVQRGPARPDQPNNGAVPRPGLRDVWTVMLNAGDTITATVGALAPSLDPALDIIGPDGSILAADDNSGVDGRNPLIRSARAPVSGAYALRVSGSHAASSGPYALIWRIIVAAPTATSPAASVTIMTADDVAPPQKYLFYPFQGQTGQHIIIRVMARPGSDLDPVVALVDSSGTVLAQADDGPNGDMNPMLDLVIPADATYRVRVNGYGTSSGGFTLTVDSVY